MVRTSKAVPACALAMLLLSACMMSHRHEPYLGEQVTGLYTMPASGAGNQFDYTAAPPQPVYYDMPYRQIEGYQAVGLRFPSSAYNGQRDNLVDARYFRAPAGGGPKPLLIVLPIWNTHTFPSTVIARGYALHSEGSAHVLWMQGDEPLFDWFGLARLESERDWMEEFDLSVERLRGVTIDVRRLLDWAETRPEIDASRIGIIGFSMSAIVAANAAGTDPRIHTAIYMVGGASPGEIMSECGVVVDYMRRAAVRRYGWSEAEMRELFHRKLMPGDPARWRGRYRPENTLIIETEQDDCVPPPAREALWLATGKPERIVFPYNHWQPFLALTPVGLNRLTHDIYEFLDRKLLPEYGDGAPLRRVMHAP